MYRRSLQRSERINQCKENCPPILGCKLSIKQPTGNPPSQFAPQQPQAQGTQIPGYTPADSLANNLPAKTLKDLQICVTGIKFVSKELTTFKDDFVEGKSTKKAAAREHYKINLDQ